MLKLYQRLKQLVRPFRVHQQVAAGKQKPRATLPDWKTIVGSNETLWAEALAKAENGPRVLIATAIGGHPQFTVLESALSVALTLRGAKVDVLLCDAAMPACQRAKISGIKPPAMAEGRLSEVFCKGCMASGNEIFLVPGLTVLRVSQYLSDAERTQATEFSSMIPASKIPDYQLNGLPVGEHALAGALRYYGIGDLSMEAEGEAVLRRYLESSLVTAYCMRNLLAESPYDVVVNNHGIYVPHGIVSAVCRNDGVRTASWNLAYRKQCAIP